MKNPLLPLLAVGLSGLLASTGCATKKFVQASLDPVNKHVSELDKRSAENAKAIEQLDDKTGREISRVSEKANTADVRAGEADKKAVEALGRGSQAIEKAEAARTAAENSATKTGQLERVVENLENFQVSATKTVLFGFDKSALDDAAKQELDSLAQALAGARRFVIEVQGFADITGSSDYNYTLSGRRADAVVRYLTGQHKIPVYRVHTLAQGKDLPAEASDKKEARKLSRRVELKVYLPNESYRQSAERR